MPSFLNKVFGYKKSDDKEAARPTHETSDNSLLDGTYETISPIQSPSVFVFPEVQPTKDLDRDTVFSLFKPRSRSQKPSRKRAEAPPHLTLQLPGPKEDPDSRALGVVFEADLESQLLLDDTVIAAKRLNPLEALILIKACAQTITERGLETLGIMHPHWFSASPQVQRKLISLFVRSLTPQNRITTLSPTPTSCASAFENELLYTRSPHDVAAVLRWGLRHLSLENDRFGRDNAEWAWYNTFFQAERNASYPPKAFSELLLPQLPPSHVELLVATLGLVSSLACHAELNSISGGKLSKFLGIWLLAATRVEPSDDWNRFYARWERAGRILEHLFLVRLREESLRQRLPTRLLELVEHYPYNKGSPATEDQLLSRPRISTRQHDALFVRVESLLMHDSEQPKQHPIQLLFDAFRLPVENPSVDEYVALWNTLKTRASEEAASSDAEGFQFDRVFVDETIQLLSSIPADHNDPTSSTLLSTPISKVVSRKRSSPSKILERITPGSTTDHRSSLVSPTSPSSTVITDWVQFSLSGFGDAPTTQPLAALLYKDGDTEVTRSSRHRHGKSRSRRRRSNDHDPSVTPPSSQFKHESSVLETKLASVQLIQIDEAFIDFWSDAIVDPISADWPTFVVCGLKEISGVEPSIHWLVIEQAYVRQQPRPSRVPSPDGQRGRSPRPSFQSDISGFRINSVFSSARKRISAFSRSVTDLNTKKTSSKIPVAGELGEILVEEGSASLSVSTTQADHYADGNAHVTTTVTSGATTNITDHLKVNEISTVRTTGIPPTDLVSVPEEEFDSAPGVAKALPIEPAPQTGGKDNGLSVLPHSAVKASSVKQDSPRILDIVSPNGAADTPDLSSMQSRRDPTVLASEPAVFVQHPGTSNVQTRAEQLQQGIAVEDRDRPVEPVAQSTGGGLTSDIPQVGDIGDSWQGTETVATPLASETIAVVLATPVVNEALKRIAEEPHAIEQLSQSASNGFAAAFTVESARQHVMDDLPPVSAPDVQDKEIATETGAQSEPDLIAPVVDSNGEAADVAELVETTALEESVALPKETLGPEVPVDTCGRVGAAHDPVAKPRAVSNVTLQSVTAELQATNHHVEQPSFEVVPAVDPSVQVVTVETKHTADQVLELAAKEIPPRTQDTTVTAAEGLVLKVFPIPEAEAFIPAAVRDIALAEAEAQAQAATKSLVSQADIVETQGTGAPTPAPENAVLVDEIRGPGSAAGVYEPVESAPAVVPEPFVEARALSIDSTPLDKVQLSVETEQPTQFADAQPATEPIQEATNDVLAVADELVTLKVKAQLTSDVTTGDAEAHTSVPGSAPTEDILGVAVEANEPVELVPNVPADPDHVIEKAQVLTEETVLSASGPVAVTPATIEESAVQAVQVTVETEAQSSESVDGVVNPLTPGVSDLEEFSPASAEAQLEPQVPRPSVDTADVPQEVVKDAELLPVLEGDVPVEETRTVVDAGESETFATESELAEVSAPTPVVAEENEEVMSTQPETAVPVLEINETSGVNDPQDTEVAEQPVRFEIEVSTYALAEL